jgi:hypothetical protein
MSVRKKAFFANAIFLMNAIGGFVAGVMIDFRLTAYVLVVALIFGIYQLTLRCPRCGQWIYKRRAKFLDMDFTYYGGNPVPRYCARCGQDLNQTSVEEPLSAPSRS